MERLKFTREFVIHGRACPRCCSVEYYGSTDYSIQHYLHAGLYMAIRHWHPLKLVLIWVVALLVLVILWEAESPRHHAEAIFIWLILSIPVFIITWKWASARESKQLATSTNKPCRLRRTLDRIEESFSEKFKLAFSMMLGIVLFGGSSAYLWASFVSYRFGEVLFASLFWWIVGTTTFVYVWLAFKWRHALGGAMSREGRVLLGLMIGAPFVSLALITFIGNLIDEPVQTLVWISVLLLGLLGYICIPTKMRNAFFELYDSPLGRSGWGALVGLVFLAAAMLVMSLFGDYLDSLGERYNHLLRALAKLPEESNLLSR